MTDGTFKGGVFLNRYRITGTLTTVSPLHVGDGGMMSDNTRLPPQEEGEEVPKFSTIVTDVNNHAYIPGSTIKGNLRAWLTQILTRFNAAYKNDEARAKVLREEAEKNKRFPLTMAEYLFGSAVNEGKLEFWNATLRGFLPIQNNHQRAYLGYHNERGTIILKSVAIDPSTGTAAEKKLYNYEVVPEGAKFTLTVCGQNLKDEELGMLLFALEGFNSAIYPVTLGAMRSIGFGRFKFEIKNIYLLNGSNISTWLESSITSGQAGYDGLEKVPEAKRTDLLNSFKEKFKEAVLKQGG